MVAEGTLSPPAQGKPWVLQKNVPSATILEI